MMPLSHELIRHLADELSQPSRFSAAQGVTLAHHHLPAEVLRWEVFQGRLLPPEQTRRQESFESWNVHLVGSEGASPAPIVSLKLGADGRLHVVRGVDSYVQEGYDSGGGVYLTREVRRWALELIASFDMARFDDPATLRDEIASAIARALHGSRLPLTPTEAPHPLFSFGQLDYPDPHQPHRALEAWLRRVPLEEVQVPWWPPELDDGFLTRLWQVFQDISLSPWTDFGEKVMCLLRELGEPALDFEARLLRLIGRHLTAYDLVTFHYRGANYPDALLLDMILKDYLDRLELQPELFAGEAGRLRRRALRQAWAIRRGYEGHAVPDVPTSPGEHARAYPGAYPRVAEEQILQSGKRRHLLFAEAPLSARLTPAVRAALAAALADLEHPAEQRELGAALYLDRPFGGGKAPVEPDGTPLLASLAYSRTIAARRLAQLTRELGLTGGDAVVLPGLPLEAIGPPVRPTSLGLADAARASPDFVFLHTLAASVRQLRELFDFAPLAERTDLAWMAHPVLLARPARGEGLIAYDAQWRPRLHLVPVLERGYASRRGLEWPADGLRVTRIDEMPADVHLPAKEGAR